MIRQTLSRTLNGRHMPLSLCMNYFCALMLHGSYVCWGHALFPTARSDTSSDLATASRVDVFARNKDRPFVVVRSSQFWLKYISACFFLILSFFLLRRIFSAFFFAS